MKTLIFSMLCASLCASPVLADTWDWSYGPGSPVPTANLECGPTITGPFTIGMTVPANPPTAVYTPPVQSYCRVTTIGGVSNVVQSLPQVVPPTDAQLIAALQATVATLQTQVTAIQTQVTQVAADTAATAAKTTTNTSDLRTDEIAANITSNEVTALQTSVASLQTAVTTVQGGLAAVNTSLTSRTAEIAALQTTVTTITSALNAMTTAVTALKTALTALTTRTTEAERKLAMVCLSAKQVGGAATTFAGLMRKNIPCP